MPPAPARDARASGRAALAVLLCLAAAAAKLGPSMASASASPTVSPTGRPTSFVAPPPPPLVRTLVRDDASTVQATRFRRGLQCSTLQLPHCCAHQGTRCPPMPSPARPPRACAREDEPQRHGKCCALARPRPLVRGVPEPQSAPAILRAAPTRAHAGCGRTCPTRARPRCTYCCTAWSAACRGPSGRAALPPTLPRRGPSTPLLPPAILPSFPVLCSNLPRYVQR